MNIVNTILSKNSAIFLVLKFEPEYLENSRKILTNWDIKINLHKYCRQAELSELSCKDALKMKNMVRFYSTLRTLYRTLWFQISSILKINETLDPNFINVKCFHWRKWTHVLKKTIVFIQKSRTWSSRRRNN